MRTDTVLRNASLLRQMSRLSLPLFLFAALHSEPALASHVVNGTGWGSVTASAWCKTAPPAAPTHTATWGPGRNLGGLIGPFLGGGCALNTRAGGANGPLWAMFSLSFAGPGDVASDEASDLYSLITPVSDAAHSEISVTAEVLGPNKAVFHINWFGTDAGTAARLQWREGSRILDEELCVGPWRETSENGNQLDVTITSTGDIYLVDLVGDNIAAGAGSTPTVPQSWGQIKTNYR